ncbi:hypothetical protein [Dyadobacter bucti]|uniref:hypothetical protein n=1 Tax=Dyadobacter bucti TaxID=2572203 RepID=UPI003F7054D8
MADDYELENLICPECNHHGTESTRCHWCGGDGCFDTSDEDFLIEGSQYEPCEECKGTGILRHCPECGEDLSGRNVIDPDELYDLH